MTNMPAEVVDTLSRGLVIIDVDEGAFESVRHAVEQFGIVTAPGTTPSASASVEEIDSYLDKMTSVTRMVMEEAVLEIDFGNESDPHPEAIERIGWSMSWNSMSLLAKNAPTRAIDRIKATLAQLDDLDRFQEIGETKPRDPSGPSAP